MKASSFKLIPLFVFIFCFSRLFSLQATVNSWNARMEIEDAKKNGGFLILLPGTAVQTDKSKDAFIHISYNGLSGWIRKDYLTIYADKLSDIKSKPSLSGKITRENGKDYLFLHKKGKLIKYNITDRSEENSQSVPDFQEIYPSTRSSLFLLKGVTTNIPAADNLELFDISSGKSIYIGSFREDTIEISGIKFSGESDLMSILFRIRGQYLLCVYKTDSGELYAYTMEASGFNWRNDLLILNDNKNFWSYDLSSAQQQIPILNFKKDNMIFKIRPEWLRYGFLKSSVRNDTLFIDTGAGVLAYDFNLKTIRLTPLKSLMFNNDMNLNYYLLNNRAYMYNFRSRHDLEQFRGSQPDVSFEAFAESNIIGRSKYEKIDTLSLYSDEGEVVYRYKAIDDPMALGDTGIIAEVSTEKDLMILSVEDPVKQEFFYIFDRGN